jgi:hypothetical protein
MRGGAAVTYDASAPGTRRPRALYLRVGGVCDVLLDQRFCLVAEIPDFCLITAKNTGTIRVALRWSFDKRYVKEPTTTYFRTILLPSDPTNWSELDPCYPIDRSIDRPIELSVARMQAM